MFAAANRNNTSIYAVDPRGLSTGEFDITTNISGSTSQAYLNNSMDSLRSLAENTDGRAIVNRNDLGTAMKQIVRDASAYYLIGYTSTQAPMDGKFHEIRVRVKRPGVQVRARKGYWAYTEADAKRAEAGPRAGPPAAVTKALSTLAPHDQSPLRAHVDWHRARRRTGWRRSRSCGSRCRRRRASGATRPRRVTLLATSPAGDIVYRGRMPATLAPTGYRCGHQLRRQARQARPAHHDRRRRHRHARHRRPRAGGAGPVGARARCWARRRCGSRAARASSRRWRPAPATPPTAMREFRRTDRLLIRVRCVCARDRAADGDGALSESAGHEDGRRRRVAPPAAGEPYSIDLPLASYAAGQYLLELTANSEGHKPVTELVAFRITVESADQLTASTFNSATRTSRAAG